MCGFVGFSGVIENRKEILNKMQDRIIHRGPDMAGDYLDDGIALGFRRLSILDLSSEGAQPMSSPDGRYTIVYNGEVYNYRELREELTALSHSFSSDCDTEVLLHGYIEWGEGLVDRIRGMFAFVIWDKIEKSLFGARDFFGIKPFYYGCLSDGNIIFGSEIKAFLPHPLFVKEVNPAALRPYLTFQYSSQEETFFKGVFKLPPAHCFTYKNGKMKMRRYWDINFTRVEESFEECTDRLDKSINESVKAHKISDVPIGAFLSGGVDSSYVTASMMPEKSFSVGFDFNKFNETDYAAELSEILGKKNFKKMLTADECFEAFPDIQYHMDEPQSNPSSVPLWFLSKIASEQVTVVLSGEGADEIFAGYEWYGEREQMRKYKKLPRFLRILAAKIVRHLPYFKGHDLILESTGRPEDYFIGQALVYTEKEAVDILTPKYRNAPTPHEIAGRIYSRVSDKDELTKKQYLDLNLWMPGDILLKADKMSMAHSLELRVPFLDREVMKTAEGIPAEYKITPENTKVVLRAAANKTIPDDWANRPKVGFPVPIRYWLKEEKYYKIVKEYFTSEYAKEFFDTDKLNAVLDDHYNGRAQNGRKIWTAFTFLVWYKRFFIDEK